MYALLFSSGCSTCPANRISLDVIILLLIGEEYTLCSTLQFPDTHSFLAPNIRFSNTLSRLRYGTKFTYFFIPQMAPFRVRNSCLCMVKLLQRTNTMYLCLITTRHSSSG
jgi:hypothetical protein